MSARDRVIVALDVPTEAQARAIVEALGDAASFHKSGLQLLTAAGRALMRATLGAAMLIVTPGIQLVGEGASDQARTATPAQAIGAGATHIVHACSITQAADARATFEAVCADV